MNKILIAGGTGFVGKHLISFLLERGYTINVLTRKKQNKSFNNIQYYQWDIDKGYIEKQAFEGVDTIINLTGTNIAGKRWTKIRKTEILDSRIKPIHLLYQYVEQNNFKIKTFISSSAVGYYGAITSDKIFTETSNYGNDFLASVCQKWELAALHFNNLRIRTVILRKGVVIGKDGGMYRKMATLAKLAINVSFGNGKQFLPWIDIRDLVCIYNLILKSKEIAGIFNAVSSEHITMNDFSKTLLQSFGKKNFLPSVPSFLIRMMFGEMSVMLLEGSKISNDKLKNAAFTFKFYSIKKSLSNLR